MSTAASQANRTRQPPSQEELRRRYATQNQNTHAQTTQDNAETKSKEQEKINAISEEWKQQLKSDDEIEEILSVARRHGQGRVVDGVIQPCPNLKAKNLDCVPAYTEKKKVSKRVIEAVKKAQELKRSASKTIVRVDYARIAEWEGGSYSGGYVPWGPKLKVVQKNIGETGKPKIVNILFPDTLRVGSSRRVPGLLKGRSKSGATVAAGVDLGAKDQTHSASLKKAARSSGLMSQEKVNVLSEKLKPYYGKKRLAACQQVRETPLHLEDDEEDLLNYESFMEHTDRAINQYKKATGLNWSNLSAEEQTMLLSQVYHHGSVSSALAKAVGNHEQENVLNLLHLGEGPTEEREAQYMNLYYEQKNEESDVEPLEQVHQQIP